MGQGALKLAEDGLVLKGRGEDGAWLVEVRRQDLRVFGDGLDTASSSSSTPVGLFVEASDTAGPAVSGAVSELNALLAERDRSLKEALRLLDRLLQDAVLSSQEQEEEEEEQDEVLIDPASGPEDEEPQPTGQPQIHEASVLPSAGCEEELEVSMQRLVESFARAGASMSVKALERRGVAVVVLRHCGWDDAEALRQLQANASALLAEAGVASQGKLHSTTMTSSRCGVCFEDFVGEVGSGLSLDCGHLYCKECWKQQLETVARGGPGGGAKMLDATCPEPACNLRVCLDMYERLGLNSLASSYRRALLRSFLDESGAVVECPGCKRHVLLGPARPDAGPCRHCSRRFCSLCFQEAHGPLTCAERRAWLKMLEDTQESMLTRWTSRLKNIFLLEGEEAVARRCPNPECSVMSQKVEGCLFLKCPRCRESWCWHCGAWGGGPSGRPQPHHVFVCTDVPTDVTWLDGHSTLREDARFAFHQSLWEERVKAMEEAGGTQHADASASRAGVEPEASAAVELAAAAAEAREVLSYSAAWRFFERDEAQRRLFEFAEADLAKLLAQLGQEPPEWERWSYRTAEAEAAAQARRGRTLSAALRTQAQALRSYRHVGSA
mmetsp:Transcript_113954/g.333003  ORF Transcript_113954/g.333003 Transcript_113954/m.333003 type:complete len:610 (+) Transcript_113954:121-1950(+)